MPFFVNTEPRDRCAHEQEEHRLIDHFIEMYQIVKQRVIIQPEGVEGGRRVVVDRGRSRVQRLNHPRNGKFMTYWKNCHVFQISLTHAMPEVVFLSRLNETTMLSRRHSDCKLIYNT